MKGPSDPRAILAMREALVRGGILRPDASPGATLREIARRLDAGPIESTPLLRAGYVEPTWLAPLADVYRRAELALRGEGPPVHATFSGPAQTGKSAFAEVSMARIIARNPSAFLATLSYGAALALPRSRRIRDDVVSLGVALRDDSQGVEQWATTEGGGLLATGVRGPLTGQPGLGVINVEDPYKDATGAESQAINAELREFFDGVVLTRLGARTSTIVSFARWSPKDLIGYIRSKNLPHWEHYTLPAIDAAGEPIPRIPGKDRAFYEMQRLSMDPHMWEALMMGEPRPRDGRLFVGAPPTYDERPGHFARICIGIDFAYSSRSSADYSAAVVVGRCDDGRRGYYVLDFTRKQCSLSEWGMELRMLRARWPSATLHAYIGGTELGTIDALSHPPHSLRIVAERASASKHARAQNAAALWSGNESDVIAARARLARGEFVQLPTVVPRRIYVPTSASWVAGFVERLLDFSGAKNDTDDDVDALAAAVDACGPLPSGAVIAMPSESRAAGWQPGQPIPRRHR